MPSFENVNLKVSVQIKYQPRIGEKAEKQDDASKPRMHLKKIPCNLITQKTKLQLMHVVLLRNKE